VLYRILQNERLDLHLAREQSLVILDESLRHASPFPDG
jgi:hypothetical protein